MLPLRLRFAGKSTLDEMHAKIREDMLFLAGLQNIPLDDLVKDLGFNRLSSQDSLIQAILNFTDAPEGRLDDQAKYTRYPLGNGAAHTDMVCFVELGKDGSLLGEMEYDSDIFSRGSIESFCAAFAHVLDAWSDLPTQGDHSNRIPGIFCPYPGSAVSCSPRQFLLAHSWFRLLLDTGIAWPLEIVDTELTTPVAFPRRTTGHLPIESPTELVANVAKKHSILYTPAAARGNPRELSSVKPAYLGWICGQIWPSIVTGGCVKLPKIHGEKRWAILELTHETRANYQQPPRNSLSLPDEASGSPGARIVNLYGPTEGTVFSSYSMLRYSDSDLRKLVKRRRVAVDNLVPSAAMTIVSDSGRELPRGFVGEIVIWVN
ncbi:condensation domain protein [Ceratobasidium sp. AG-Ba]|nr:condensation domain protein [Ceratobasidium sp. AG-Ba]